jgi:hypothetical protein
MVQIQDIPIECTIGSRLKYTFQNYGMTSCSVHAFNMSDVSPTAFLIWNHVMKFGICHLFDVATSITSNWYRDVGNGAKHEGFHLSP